MRRLWSLALMLVFVAGSAGAQGVAETSASTSGCSVAGASSATVTCMASGDYQVTATGTALPGYVAGSTHIARIGTEHPPSLGGGGTASATFHDILRVTSPNAVPAYAVFTLGIDSYASLWDYYANATGSFDAFTAAGSGSVSFRGSQDLVWFNGNHLDVTSADGGLTTISRYGDASTPIYGGVFRLEMPFTGGDIHLRYSTSLSTYFTDVADPFGSSTVSLGVGGVEFLDAAHGVIQGVSVSSVPEPSSLALLGTGLFGIIPFARRRRLH